MSINQAKTGDGKMEKRHGDEFSTQVNLFLVERLKKEINALADRLSADLKKENLLLIRQVAALKAENERLNRELYGSGDRIARRFDYTARYTASTIQRPKNY